MLSCLFPHLGFPGFPTTHSHHHTKIADVIISNLIVNLLKFVVLSSLRCLVPVLLSIIVTISSHYNNISNSWGEVKIYGSKPGKS